ncbi:DUF1751-domain-containing protein [Ascodesmis nigricans]|uniref:DUF1751-domain-containing protein n=1 Tax=Ascodesmis nigricans TaxID=341454 RepID=A0A4S2MTE4_9PEZI|nr:DUF1751-domain-containing protein [Ascodesmis nigricans]
MMLLAAALPSPKHHHPRQPDVACVVIRRRNPERPSAHPPPLHQTSSASPESPYSSRIRRPSSPSARPHLSLRLPAALNNGSTMPRGITIPPITRACLVSCVALSVLNAALRYSAYIHNSSNSEGTPGESPDTNYVIPYLSIVPARSILYPWTFVTASLVEQNIFTLSVTLTTLFYCGKYLERAWGSRELAKFLLVVMLIPNFLTFLAYALWFAISGNPVRSFTPICGATAIQAGFLVAFKQLVPEYTVRIFKNMIRIRIKRFPAIFLLVNTLSGPLLGTDVAVFLSWLGFFSSWTYLRFYKKTYPDLEVAQDRAIKGDASESFAIINFFPAVLHPALSIIANTTYNLLLTLNLCVPFSDADIALSNAQAQARGNAGLGAMFAMTPGQARSSRAETERRRELALRALDQQLSAATGKVRGGETAGSGTGVGDGSGSGSAT